MSLNIYINLIITQLIDYRSKKVMRSHYFLFQYIALYIVFQAANQKHDILQRITIQIIIYDVFTEIVIYIPQA